MSVNPGTQKAKALLALVESDGRLTQRDVANEIGTHYASSPLSELWQEDYLVRDGSGGPHDPYRYTVTSEGIQVAEDLGYSVSATEQLEIGLENEDPDIKDDHIKRALQILRKKEKCEN